MKESTIINGMAANAENVAALYKQIVRLDARLQAIEKVLSNRPAFLDAIISPKRFWAKVNAKHEALMASYNKQVQQYAAEMEAERKRPKIQVVRP